MNAFILFAIFIILFESGENKKLQKSFEEIFGDGWHLKGMGEEGKVNLGQIMGQENDQQQKRSAEDQSNHRMINESDQNEKAKNGDNDQQQKREIIRKFRQIKEEIKQKGKQSRKEWNKIERTITKKLGTNRSKIYEWMRELGIKQRKKQKIYTEEQKRKIVQEFRAKKEQIKRQKRKLSCEEWNKFECEIAKKLGTSRSKIYEWIRELGMKKQKIYTEEQKRKIVQEFLTIKERIKQQKRGKYSRKQWNRMDKLLAKKLGTNREKIYKWMNELGMGQEIRIKERRMAIMRKYWEMKQNDPKISDVKIAKALKVSGRSISKWKAQFGGRDDKAF